MFCEHCGTKIDSSFKFCTVCGQSITQTKAENQNTQIPTNVSGDNWWQRLLKVAYIILYIPLLLILPAVWMANSQTYDYSLDIYADTAGKAFWYCLIALVVYVALARLIKITVLYITLGIKPEWKKEFRRFF